MGRKDFYILSDGTKISLEQTDGRYEIYKDGKLWAFTDCNAEAYEWLNECIRTHDYKQNEITDYGIAFN